MTSFAAQSGAAKVQVRDAAAPEWTLVTVVAVQFIVELGSEGSTRAAAQSERPAKDAFRPSSIPLFFLSPTRKTLRNLLHYHNTDTDETLSSRIPLNYQLVNNLHE